MIKIELKYNIVQDDDGATIKHILRDKLNISSRLLNKLKMNEKILVNNIPVFSNYIVHYKDEIIVKIDFEGIENIPLLPTKIEGTLCVCPNKYYEGFFVAKIRKNK